MQVPGTAAHGPPMAGKGYQSMLAPTKWRDGLLVALGLCLIVAPLLLDFLGDGRAAWHSLLAGAVLFGLGTAALNQQRRWEEITVLVLGLWLVVAPFVLGFDSGTAIAVHRVLGVLVAVDAAWNIAVTGRHPSGPSHA